MQITKKGIELPVKLNVKVFKNNNKESVLVFVKDVITEKKYKYGLDNEHDLFTVLMENIPDRIYFKDINSKFVLVNRAQSSNFNLTDPSEAIGLCDHDFFDKKHADQALKDEQKIVKTKKPMISKIEREKIQSPGKTYEWVNSTKVPIIT